MTLIIAPGDNVAFCGSDDGDSGCLAESPDDGKEDVVGENDRLTDVCLTTNIKRLSGSNKSHSEEHIDYHTEDVTINEKCTINSHINKDSPSAPCGSSNSSSNSANASISTDDYTSNNGSVDSVLNDQTGDDLSNNSSPLEPNPSNESIGILQEKCKVKCDYLCVKQSIISCNSDNNFHTVESFNDIGNICKLKIIDKSNDSNDVTPSVTSQEVPNNNRLSSHEETNHDHQQSESITDKATLQPSELQSHPHGMGPHPHGMGGKSTHGMGGKSIENNPHGMSGKSTHGMGGKSIENNPHGMGGKGTHGMGGKSIENNPHGMGGKSIENNTGDNSRLSNKSNKNNNINNSNHDNRPTTNVIKTRRCISLDNSFYDYENCKRNRSRDLFVRSNSSDPALTISENGNNSEQTDVNSTKLKINNMRQNFLSSLAEGGNCANVKSPINQDEICDANLPGVDYINVKFQKQYSPEKDQKKDEGYGTQPHSDLKHLKHKCVCENEKQQSCHVHSKTPERKQYCGKLIRMHSDPDNRKSLTYQNNSSEIECNKRVIQTTSTDSVINLNNKYYPKTSVKLGANNNIDTNDTNCEYNENQTEYKSNSRESTPEHKITSNKYKHTRGNDQYVINKNKQSKNSENIDKSSAFPANLNYNAGPMSPKLRPTQGDPLHSSEGGSVTVSSNKLISRCDIPAAVADLRSDSSPTPRSVEPSHVTSQPHHTNSQFVRSSYSPTRSVITKDNIDNKNIMCLSYGTSSPPDRLENWKNMLAEKRQKIKSHVDEEDINDNRRRRVSSESLQLTQHVHEGSTYNVHYRPYNQSCGDRVDNRDSSVSSNNGSSVNTSPVVGKSHPVNNTTNKSVISDGCYSKNGLLVALPTEPVSIVNKHDSFEEGCDQYECNTKSSPVHNLKGQPFKRSPLKIATKTLPPEQLSVEVITASETNYSYEAAKGLHARGQVQCHVNKKEFLRKRNLRCLKHYKGIIKADSKSEGTSDSDLDLQRKNKLQVQEACQNIARALHTLPIATENQMQNTSKSKSKSNISVHKNNLRNNKNKVDSEITYKDQGIEVNMSDSDSDCKGRLRKVNFRSPHKHEKHRSSLYDNNTDRSSCDCGDCQSSTGDGEQPAKVNNAIITRRKKRPANSCKKVGKGRYYTKRNAEPCLVGKIDKQVKSVIDNRCRIMPQDVGSTSDDDCDDDYCQTDECGDECDYCSGEDAEDEEETSCALCRRNRSLSPVCKHNRVLTNGLLKSANTRRIVNRDCARVSGPKSLVIQAVLRRRRAARQELGAIREYGVTSDDPIDSEEDQLSNDGSNCDISSSWRFGLSRDVNHSNSSTLRSDKSSCSLPASCLSAILQEKSNSLPGASLRPLSAEGIRCRPNSSILLKPVSTSEDENVGSGPGLPPRPPRMLPRIRSLLTPSPPAFTGTNSSSPGSPRPTMGIQVLQQQRSPNSTRALHVSGLPVAPKTVAPRSPSNPNPPYGFPAAPSPPLLCPGSPATLSRPSPIPKDIPSTDAAPASPRVNSRAGSLVTRNFSISDDEGGQRLARRQVTITRHESVYKEAAERGYVLPPGSPVDPYWLTWKLDVLKKTLEEVGGRLDEAEKVVTAWGPVPQDPNLADQHVHNVRKFRENLPDLQRGVDDVNDQAARFSAHNIPLTRNNSDALHDLNNRWKNLETSVNDHWRKVAGRSRDVTPLTPAQLASSVAPPWERATANNKVPYYINHARETTHWDHPDMMDLLDSLSDLNHIKFSAYRTAMKLRALQKKLALDQAKLQTVTDVFDEHGLRGQNDRLIDVNDMVVVLSTLYGRIAADRPDVNTTLATDLCLNWLLNVYDSQRTGQMRVLSFRIGLICLCRGHLEEKYRYMFRLIADPNRLTDQRKLGLLLHDCVQVPRQLGEVAAFGGSNIEPSVRSCFTKAGKDRDTIEAVHFLTWVQQEPQSLVWLAVLHRVAASETVQHQVKCNICKTYPITGLRYRCLKCLSFDMCQQCFFDGRSGKSHKITHPMHEYCTATTAGDEMKDFTKALKNKFKSKRSLQKHTKKGYLPVQTVLEGDPLESPSPSPQHNVTSQDMHTRLELYASRLAEVELRTNSNSTPDSEDEHGLIAQYCQSLSSSDAPLPVPRSPLQIMASVDADQKDELEQMIKDLEEENRALQAEYDRLKCQQPVGSPPEDPLGVQRSEHEMLAEAKLLRQHKGRLEARMGILEEHNRQLEAQLHRLRQLLEEQNNGVSSPNKSGTLQTKSVTASQLAMDSPAKINGHSTQGGASSAYDGLDQMSEYVRPPPPPMGNVAHVGNLFSRAGDLGKAVGSLVATMTHEQENDSRSDESGQPYDEQ